MSDELHTHKIIVDFAKGTNERIPLKEDYDYCVQNANTYRKLLRLNYVNMVKNDHGNKGGCADYRTIEYEKYFMITNDVINRDVFSFSSDNALMSKDEVTDFLKDRGVI